MRKLIAANFYRFRKDRFSWCVAGLFIILSLVIVFTNVRSYETMAAIGFSMPVDDYYFLQAPLIGVFLALLISPFMGTEFADGTIRNKLYIGHKRNSILFSNFIACAVVSILLTAVWMLISASLFVLIGPLEMTIPAFIGCIFVTFGVAVAFAALFTVIGSLSSSKAMTVIYTFGVLIILTMVATALDDRLSIPETSTGMMLVENQLVEMESTPNPLYLTGIVRTLCELALGFLPSGQALLLSDAAVEYPVCAIGMSAVFTAITLLVGSVLFRKKDIK